MSTGASEISTMSTGGTPRNDEDTGEEMLNWGCVYLDYEERCTGERRAAAQMF